MVGGMDEPQPAHAAATPEHPMQTITVGGMSCGHCKQTVEKLLLGVPGVSSAAVDLTSGTVQVDAPKLDMAEIKKLLEKAGYELKS